MGVSASLGIPAAARLRYDEIAVADGSIAVALAGTGVPLILLHGWTLDRRMWLPQVEGLGDYFHLVMPDRRGSGQSSAPPDLGREADDILRIADALEIERFALLGLSQGAAVALDFAQRHGARVSVLLVSGAPIPALVERSEEIDIERYRAMAEAGDMSAMRADWSEHELMRHENPATRDLVDTMLADYAGRDLLAPSRLPDVSRSAIANLTMPTLALAGSTDSQWRRECAKSLADTAPFGELALIRGAGHLANLDNPGEFNAVVRDFLGR